MPLPTDHELVDRVRTGDRLAFRQLHARHRDAVRGFAVQELGDGDDADSVVQDVFWAAWRHADELAAGHTTVLPWLLRAAAFRVSTVHRTRGRRPVVETVQRPPDDGATLDLDEVVQSRLRLASLRERLAAMLPLDAQAFLLVVEHGEPHDMVARALGISVDSVAKRVSRVRARLRRAAAEDTSA